MNQKIVVSLLVALLVPGGSAFAQFKVRAQAALNAQNLDRIIKQTAYEATRGEKVMSVPTAVLSKGSMVIRPAAFPKVVTPVSASWKQYVKNSYGDSFEYVEHYVRGDHNVLLPLVVQEWAWHGGSAFYDNATTLAQHLNSFYEGKATVLIDPQGREVKLYALPVDSILYKPAGYKTPVVLNPEKYFVIYDVKANTGKIAENRPEVYKLFKPRVEDEIWQAMGADKVFNDLSNLCNAILMVHLHKTRAEQLRAEGVVRADTKTLVQGGRVEVYEQLNTSSKLLAYLKKFPQVRQLKTRLNAYVVELPVEGLVLEERDGSRQLYNSKDHVMLFFEMGAVGIFQRADVENPALFKPIEKNLVAQHPQNTFWKHYESEKKAFKIDRQNKTFEDLWSYLYPYHFNSQAELGRALYSFQQGFPQKVVSKTSFEMSHVYEIPVNNLTCIVEGKNLAVDPDEYVFLYNEQTGGNLVKRTDLENANLYQFVAQ